MRGTGVRAGEQELYTLFYDIKQAYDSVQVEVLVRAMHRLRMPHAFVDLIADSLTGLTSCVRTAFGVSQLFEVLRSLRQGDPLAPLLFVILMDALHEGLECNPFTNERHGLRLEWRRPLSASIPSLGYADDTTVLTNTLASMRIQNDWVHYFMAFNRLRLNHSKCELVGREARRTASVRCGAGCSGDRASKATRCSQCRTISPSATSACTVASMAAGRISMPSHSR